MSTNFLPTALNFRQMSMNSTKRVGEKSCHFIRLLLVCPLAQEMEALLRCGGDEGRKAPRSFPSFARPPFPSSPLS